MYKDVRGLAVAAAGQESVDHLDAAVEAYLGARRDTLERASRLTDEDPDCVLGHCVAGYLQMHRCRPEAAAIAKESLAQATSLSERQPVSDREKLHIGALRAWVQGESVDALEQWEAILTESPRDILAIRLAQFMTSYLGNSQGIRESIERVFPKWDDKVPGYGYLLGCYAYGLEESGNYGRAETFGRAAIELNPQDLWAAHAVAHVMEMQGRPREGIAWVTENERHWKNCSNFTLHLKWHGALYRLALEDYPGVLEMYDREIRAESIDEYLDIANAASVLWRLEQANVDVGQRWEELAARAAQHIDDHFFVFADLHYMIAAAGGPASGAEQFVQSCSVFARSGRGTQAKVMDQVGLAIGRATLAHRQGRYSEAVDHLLSRRNLMHRVGGSHAQRDTFEMLLIDSAVRAGNHRDAHVLLAERTSRRPNDLWSWRTWEALSQARGKKDEAAKARIQVERLSASNQANQFTHSGH
jgi:tetratricopeptide (TPR) repeat protein